MLLGLRVGDAWDEVAEAWMAKESVREIYFVEDPADAAVLVDMAIGCREDDVAETGASKGPTEGLNLLIKKVKRTGHGFRRFDHFDIGPEPRLLRHLYTVHPTCCESSKATF